MTSLKIGSKFITVNGKRIGVNYFKGPWIGIDQSTIKIRPKQYSFPIEIRAVFNVTNNSDPVTDYFERDCIAITSSHPLYSKVASVA